jgi:lipopolysaccharide export system protein LptA
VTANNPHHVVFIDARVPDLQDLLDGLLPGEQAFVIDQASGGLEQIAAILAANHFTDLAAISIVSHGTTGALVLGTSLITDGNLADHSGALAAIGGAVAPGGAVQLYGCDVAQGQAGQQFINDFSTYAGGVQVDAATHTVGSASLGGSWILDAMSAAPAATGVAPNSSRSSATDASLGSDDTSRPVPSPAVSPFNSDGLPTPPAATAPPSTAAAATQSTSSAAAAATAPFTAAALDNFQGQLVSPPSAQLFFRINQGNDVQLGAINNTGATATPTSIYFGGGFTGGTPQNIGLHNGNETSVAVDTAAGLVFSVGIGKSTDTTPPINNSYDAVSVFNLKTGALIETIEFGPNTGDANTDDVVQALTLDPFTNTLYVGDWGTDLAHTGVAKFTYNPLTGLLTPSASGTGSTSITTTQPNGSSSTTTANGIYLFNASQVSQYTNANALYLDTANHKLYYTNDDSGYNISPYSPTNAVYVTDTTTLATTQLTSLTQFPTANQSLSGHDQFIGPNGSILGLAVDVAHNVVFFETTDNVGSANNALWWVDTTGANQTATKITLPAGVTLDFAGQTSEGGDAAGLTFDPSTQQLWLTNAQNDTTTPDLGKIYQLSWNSVSHTVSLINTYDTAQLVGATPATVDSFDAPSTTFLDILPTLVTNGTSSQATEQSSAVTLLSATPTITDVDGNHLAGASVQITGGTFVSNESSAADDHLTILGASSGVVSGTSITISYSSATETLTLTGYDTLAHYQTALSQVQYNTTGDNPTNYGSNTTRTITWQVDDGAVGNPSGVNNVTTTTLTVVGVNDAPALSGTGNASFTENGAVVTLSGAAAVTDPDNLNLASATVAITGGTFAGDGDVLTFSTTGTSITASYDSLTETLTLTGSDTLAHYQQVLDSVTFSTPSDNPTNYGSNPTRTVTWTLNDGSASNATTIVTTTVSITAVNDPPTVAGTTNASFTENGAPVTLSPSVTVSDPDSLGIVGGSVHITGGTFAGDGDVLGANVAGTSITASYDSTTETLTLTGSDTLAHYQQVLDTVTFVTASDNPDDFGSAPTRTITWALNDGAASNAIGTVTTTVGITAANDAPTLSAVAASATFTEKGAAVTLSGAAAVTDPDNLNLASATVAITGGTFAGDGDVLAVNVGGTSITASYNAATETLALSGSDTLAHYMQVLDTLTFQSTSLNPTDSGSNPTRTVTWVLNDGSASNALSATATETVTIAAVNDAPTLSLGTTSAGFAENGASFALSPTVSVSDPDNTTWVGATVKVAGGTFAGDGDVLAADTTGTSITASYDAATETLFLSGTDTLVDYQHVLQSVTFVTPSDNPTNYGSAPTRTVTWVANDGSSSNNLSTAQTETVSIAAVNDSPTLSNVAAAVQTKLLQTVTVSPNASVGDPDNQTLVSATVAVTGGAFAGDGDVLAVNVGGTSITASYNAATETLTLSGSDTLAHYQQVLDGLTFSSGADPTNSGANPTRTLTWTLNDGSASSASVTTTVSISTVNDAPTLSNIAASATVTEFGPAVTLSGNASVADPDNQTLASATVKVVGGAFAGDGDQFAGNVGGTAITASYNAATETLTLTGSDTLAHYQQVLDSVIFASTSFNPTNYGSNPTRIVTWVLNDGSFSNNLSAVQTETVTIAAVNNAPTVGSVAVTKSFTENGGAVTASPSLSVTDPDNLTLVGATVSVANGFAGDGDVLSFDTAGTGITGSYNAATETLVFSGVDTVAHYQSVLDSVAFNSTSHNPTNYGSNLSRVLTWVVDDGSASSNLSAPQFTTVVITAVNDAPTLSSVPSVEVFPPGQTLTLAASLALTDPDNLGLANATVKVTGGAFAGDGDVLSANVAGTSITASYNAATETLTLTGSDTLAHYQQVLDSVTLTSGANPSNSGLNPTRTLSWVVNDGSGSNNTAVATTTISISTLVKNDFNGDHKSEILFQDTAALPAPSGGRGHGGGGGDVNSGVPLMYLMNGTTVSAQATLPNPTIAWHIVGSGDFNGDNKADILWQNADGTPSIWTMNGSTVTSQTALPNAGASWHAIGTGDFNGDGKSDILFQNTDGTPLIWLMNNTTVAAVATLADPGASWHAVGTGDFNGDGKSDLVFQNTDGTPLIWLMNGTSVTATAALSNPGSSWHLVGTGDFNIDGVSDLLFQSNDGTPMIWTMNGTSVAASTTLANPGLDWHAIGTGDYNGDGKADILFQNTDGTPLVWTMNGATVTASATLPNPGINWHANTG